MRLGAKLAGALGCDPFPPGQQQVLLGIVGGGLNKVIAYEPGLSIRTVEAYRAQLFAKLGVRSTAEAVRVALAGDIEAIYERV